MAGSKPVVHGYVRMAEPDEVQIGVLCKDIGTFCTLNGYRLGSIFIDRGVSDEEFARGGFTELLAAVRLSRAQAVVVPNLDHLSSQAFVRDALRRMVEQLGAQVLVAYQVNGRHPELDGGADLGRRS